MEGKGGGSLNKELDFRSWHCGRQGDEIETKSWNLDHGIVEGKRGKFKLDFRPWHGGRQGGNLNKELEFRSGIVEGKGGTEELDFRSWHCGRQEWNYK